jgi:predicted site-specific integrase-resolvase
MQPLERFDFWSLGHAARELGISQSSLYQKSRAGKIPTLRASDGSRLFTTAVIKREKERLSKQDGRKFVEPAA